MTTLGWILMIFTWSLLLSVLGFCYKKILTDDSDELSDIIKSQQETI
jgi:hypothetical protein